MSAGEGKGWARGKKATTDPRIANAAAAHRGKTYVRRVPIEQDRRHRSRGARTLALEWSPTMAYVVGLMATDGCLISNGRHLNFKSQDEQLVETFLSCLGRPPRYRPVTGRTGNIHYVAQFGDVEFWRWLRSIGLMPRKSLVLGALAVPRDVLFACVRGLLDGDGSITHYWYPGTGKAMGRRYEGLTTRFVSGSKPHLDWLRSELTETLGISGNLCRPDPDDPCWTLTYAIRESRALLPRLYDCASVPKLERKWATWLAYASAHVIPATGADLERSERRAPQTA